MRPVLVCLLLAAMPLASAGRAQAQQQAVTETSPARAAAERFVAALKAPGSIAPFIESAFATSALARESAADRARQFDRLKSDSGGFDVLEWRPQGARMVEAVAVSRQGKRHAKLVLFTSGKEPGKIADVFVLPERDPARAAKDAFPATGVDDMQLVRLVRRRMDSLADEGSFSGALLIARGDKVLLREARGMADEVWRIPNRADTRFNIASVGKMWTAVIIMKLVEEGRLSLDDSLARWVPAYPHQAAASRITLRHLLQHRAGLGEWDGRRAREAQSPSQLASTMTEAPSEPDRAFAYSNAGYVLLGAAAENAASVSYEQLVERYVFKPAGMTRSGFWPVTAIVPNRATGYLRPATDPLGFGPKFSNEQFLGYGGDPSGGAYSTTDDLFAFHRALVSGRLLKPETLSAMVETSVEFAGSPRPWRYGLGLRLETCAGTPVLGHGGGGANSGVSAATFATVGGPWTIVVLGNIDPMPEQLGTDVCELVHRS